MATLTEINTAQQKAAASRWRLILELSKTMTLAEIGLRMGVSRARVYQLVNKGRKYFGEDGQATADKSGGQPEGGQG